MTNFMNVQGVSAEDLKYAKSRGAEFGERVAVELEHYPEDVELQEYLMNRLDYDASEKLLIWDGAMTREEYTELRKSSADVWFGNAILDLFYKAFWLKI